MIDAAGEEKGTEVLCSRLFHASIHEDKPLSSSSIRTLTRWKTSTGHFGVKSLKHSASPSLLRPLPRSDSNISMLLVDFGDLNIS
jgi:hypothetical protein